ncbi:hypothetical protein LY632_05920 [Erythrobacter sp. SDW2]|uniref:hypothetical protein n=1 Tax=Erythrobacter sp. SDW2 TaxID=2907154 RepID=UPI001F436894|nr:hypothetical protein [Erythrobacter sp. SDW2]UIP07933.1 hypothetical protein LY632_05920 [Erythrobacter sp. SDW2]
MRLVLPIAAAIALAACSSEKSGSFETEGGERGEYTVDSIDGGMNATITTKDGTATMQSGENVKADLPDGFTVYPGAKVVSATNVDSPESKGSLLMMETSDSPDKVAAFYRKQAEAAGIKIEMEMTVNGGKMIGGKGPDERVFSLNTTNNDGKTGIQLTVGQGKLGS